MNRKYFLFIIIAFFACAVHAQITKVTMDTRNPALYERTDFTVHLQGIWENPFFQEEAALDMMLVSPSGKQIVLACFYESGASGSNSVWKARFAPRETGNYTCYFRYTEKGEVKSKSDNQTFAVHPSDSKGFLTAGKNFWTLSFDNGQPFRAVATSMCWESRESENTSYHKISMEEFHKRYNYDMMFPKFAKNGGNFTRVWMSTFPFESANPRGHRYTAAPDGAFYNPSVLARMDHFFDLLKENDIYLMLCFDMGNTAQRGENMFIGEKSRKNYKNRLRYLIARYGYSAHLAYWEFFNEVDNTMYNRRTEYTPEQVVAWHAEMSKYLKDNDPYHHLVTTSISHRDIPGLNSIENIDLNQMHIYKHTSSIPLEIWRNISIFNKPYVIGEFGYEWDWDKNFDDFVDQMIIDFKRGLWYGLLNPTPITPMSWWWEYFDEKGMIPYFRGVREISDRMLRDGRGDFRSTSAKTAGADAYAVICGDVVYAYAFNKTTEVITDHIAVNFVNHCEYKVEWFDPTTMKYTDKGTVNARTGMSVPIPPLQPNDEIVVICTPLK